MGLGRFDPTTHKFDLILSVRYNASSNDLAQWQKAFQRASELLYDATDGKHQLGTVQVCLNNQGDDAADAFLTGTPGISHAGAIVQLGTPRIHMTINNDEMFKPLVIVHELGHYIYGLRDEYNGPGGGGVGSCLGHTGSTPNSNACIMEAQSTDGDQFNATTGMWSPGAISEFCSINTHTQNNEQQSANLKSCWETMATGAKLSGGSFSSGYPDLQPIPATPLEAPPAGPAKINWALLDSAQRFVLVIDRSGSMTGAKLTEAKFGADWWADALLDNDGLAVVSFSDNAFPDFGMTTITGAARNVAHSKIDAIHAGGNTSIGAGLREALHQIIMAGPQATTESIVLLTDGIQNTGETPGQVLPDLIARGVRVYTIGIGPDVDSALLQQIATSTGGTYYVA